MARLLTPEDLRHQLPELPGWAVTDGRLTACYRVPKYRTGVALVVAVADEAEDMDHHPNIELTWGRVTFALSTHSAGGLTQLDVELAHRISAAAARLGGTVEPPT